MTYTLDSLHPLSDFIQERSFGALIRQWLMMCEADRIVSIKTFRENYMPPHVKTMETTLLQLAAAYPNHVVRTELIWLYGMFMQESNRRHPYASGALAEDFNFSASVRHEPTNA